jgi:hypothetical protein
MSKGSSRRREDHRAIERNWPFPDPKERKVLNVILDHLRGEEHERCPHCLDPLEPSVEMYLSWGGVSERDTMVCINESCPRPRG